MATRKAGSARRVSAKKSRTTASSGRTTRDVQPTIAWQQSYKLSTEEAERALKTGEHAALLEDYFGPDQYQELRRMAQEATSRTVRGGPRVLILPGILGSTLGIDRGEPFNDVYWFDPLDIAKGYLADLTLPDPQKRFSAIGVILFTYIKMKFALQLGGYDAEFFPYDWRYPISDAADHLLATMAADPASQIHIVAHSMGGLVTRTAISRAGKAAIGKLGRLIMLGTPNHGSFAPVQAIRGTYGTVVKVARLDQKHDADWLSRNVFGSFPGLYQMLPTAAIFNKLNLYDVASWTTDKPGPRAQILSGVTAAQKLFAPGDNRMTLIAGVNQSTAIDVRVQDGRFEYGLSNEGDGTVPLQFALLDGVKTYFVEENHGSLPNNSRVERAVIDILDHGDTKALSDQWTPQRAAIRWVPEDQLRTGPFREAEAAPLSQTEIRNLLSEYVAPDSSEQASISIAPADMTSGISTVGYQHRFDRVMVGRQRTQRIDIRFASGSITDVQARAYVIGVFEDVTPSGPAHAIDSMMKGAISDLVGRRMFSGRVGEVFIMPSGRDGLRADMVAFAGLGAFDRFNHEVQQIAAENVIRLFAKANIEEFATVLFGAGSGGGAAASLRNVLTGFLRGLRDADRDHKFRRLILCELNPVIYQEMKEELFRISSTDLCSDIELTFDEITLQPAPADVRGSSVPAAAQSVYLIVRQEPFTASRRKTFVQASVLTAGGKASVVTDTLEFDSKKWQVLKDRLEGKFTSSDFVRMGSDLGALMLPETIRAVLKTMSDRHLVVVHDSESARVPWEILCIDGWFPAAGHGLSHRYLAQDLSIAKWLEERRITASLEMLLIADPTENLPGAVDEYDRLVEVSKKLAGLTVTSMKGGEATRPAVLSALRSGKFDVVHYAGHAYFDPGDPKSSGIICAGNVTLSGADLIGVGKLPALMFFNACETGRLRKGAQKPPVSRALRVQQSAGLAEAFLRGGVANFVGTYWPVSDSAASVFASTFYEALFDHQSVGSSVQRARTAIRALNQASAQRDWADYVHFGNADFQLKVKA